MFRQLFFATRQALRHGLKEALDIAAHVKENKQLALKYIQAFSDHEIELLWKQLPANYFVQYTPFEIAWHTRNILTKRDSSEPLVLFAQHMEDITELFVYANRPHLYFANIVCAMASKKNNVQSAQIVRTNDKRSLCTIKFQNQKGAKLDNDRLSSLRKLIIANFDKKPVFTPQSNSKQSPFNVQTTIMFMDDKQKRHTNLEISTLDTQGLLAKISVTLNSEQCVINSARITTTGERADDFFAITTLHGKPLSSRRLEKLKKALLKAIDED